MMMMMVICDIVNSMKLADKNIYFSRCESKKYLLVTKHFKNTENGNSSSILQYISDV